MHLAERNPSSENGTTGLLETFLVKVLTRAKFCLTMLDLGPHKALVSQVTLLSSLYVNITNFGFYFDAGLHRYVFLVYKQPGKLTFDEKRLTNR